MLKHEDVWRGIDRLASSLGYSPSGLAKKASLDPTAFNKSKRISPDGKPRWPSTESLSKVLTVTGTTLSDFISILDAGADDVVQTSYAIPVIDFADTAKKSNFDDNGHPKGKAWSETALPGASKDGLYAITASGDTMKPLYRQGDIIVVDPTTRIRKNDRVVVKLKSGDVIVNTLTKKSDNNCTLKPLNPKHENLTVKNSDILWMARVVWVSQ